MICPECGADGEDRVTNSRPVLMLNAVRRRRECKYCKHRFTTYEVPSNKMIRSLIKLACRRQELNTLSET